MRIIIRPSGLFGSLLLLTVCSLFFCGCRQSAEEMTEGWIRIVLEMEESENTTADSGSNADAVTEILSRRMNTVGIKNALVRPEGNRRIVVEAGLSDEYPQKRLTGLLTRPARLAFHFVKPEEEGRTFAAELDRLIAEKGGFQTITPGSNPEDARSHPLLSLLYDYPEWNHLGGFSVLRSKKPILLEMLDFAESNDLIPEDREFVFSDKEYMVVKGLIGSLVYVLESKPVICNDQIVDAEVRVGLNPFDPSEPGVLVTLNSEGRGTFRIATRDHVESMLAIVLDGAVMSAPLIKEEIPNGVAQITGRFTIETAKDLSATLLSGELPVPLRVVKTQSIKKPCKMRPGSTDNHK